MRNTALSVRRLPDVAVLSEALVAEAHLPLGPIGPGLARLLFDACLLATDFPSVDGVAAVLALGLPVSAHLGN